MGNKPLSTLLLNEEEVKPLNKRQKWSDAYKSKIEFDTFYEIDFKYKGIDRMNIQRWGKNDMLCKT